MHGKKKSSRLDGALGQRTNSTLPLPLSLTLSTKASSRPVSLFVSVRNA